MYPNQKFPELAFRFGKHVYQTNAELNCVQVGQVGCQLVVITTAV